MPDTETEIPVPRFADGDHMRVIGVSERYTDATMDRMPGQWERLQQRLAEVQGQVDLAQFGLFYLVGDEPFAADYVTGVMVGEGVPLPVGFVERRIVPRRHAVFSHRGDPSGLRRLIDGIFHRWLPQSGLEAASGPEFVEVYGEDFDPVRLEGVIEVWVPLKDG